MKHLSHIVVLLLVAVLCLSSFAQEPASCQLELKKGWYAYALDFVPDADSVTALCDVSKIYVWRDGRFKELSKDDTLGVGEGFFMKVTDEECSPLTLTGTTGTAADLEKGWNLCSKSRVPADETYYEALDLEHRSYVQSPNVTANQAVWVNIEGVYLVVNLVSGEHRYTDAAPDISKDTCKTTELWLRHIPAGSFMMGSPESEVGRDATETQHEVILTEDFYIGVLEITQAQYALIWGYDVSKYKGNTRPVDRVNYNSIRGYPDTGIADWPTKGYAVDEDSFLGKLRSKSRLLFELPTEAQWEYACRAGARTALNTGKDLETGTKDEAMDEAGRYYYNRTSAKGGYSEHTGVGSYLQNKWGLYDMHGNVHEWCLDYWTSDLGSASVTDPKGMGSGTYRVLRGGNWEDGSRHCRAAYRYAETPSYVSTNGNIGFRIVMLPNVTP